MPSPTKSEQVPVVMQAKYDEITAITDTFAAQHLNEDYAQLIRYATAALARLDPSPLSKSRTKSWACGITHAIGFVNFLFDPSQAPFMKASELYKAFGVSMSTGQGKSKQVRDILDLMQLDPDWCTSAMLQHNPFATTVFVDGMMMDASLLPRNVQEELHKEGILPVIPATSDENSEFTLDNAVMVDPEVAENAMASLFKLLDTENLEMSDFENIAAEIEKDDDLKQAIVSMLMMLDAEDLEMSDVVDVTDIANLKKRPPVIAGKNDVFRFEVFIFDGLITEEFAEENPVICREIEILGKQTLADFHRIIFKAFNREDEHMYEFQVRGSGPNFPDVERYVLPMAMDDNFNDNKPIGCVTDTAIVDLNLSLDDVIGYWFDFGDDWWHQINLLETKPKKNRTKYPKITAREGASPPQYPDFD